MRFSRPSPTTLVLLFVLVATQVAWLAFYQFSTEKQRLLQEQPIDWFEREEEERQDAEPRGQKEEEQDPHKLRPERITASYLNSPYASWKSPLAPAIIHQCDLNYPDSAPCLQEQNEQILYGIEFAYPSFILKAPTFKTPAHENMFLTIPTLAPLIKQSKSCPETDPVCVDRAQRNKSHTQEIYFPSERGKLLIVKDGFYNNLPSLAWQPERTRCSAMSDWRWIVNSPGQSARVHVAKDKNFKRLYLGFTADSWSFQHFLNGAFVKMAQAWELLEAYPDFKIMVQKGNMQGGAVNKMLSYLNLSERTTLYQRGVYADEMVFPCIMPHIHPWLSLKMSELFKVNLEVPMQERKVISFLSRGKNVRNKRADLANEAQLLRAIEALLARRNKGERLEVFDHTKHPSLEDTIRYFNYDVKALIGLHGGAFFNLRFCATDTIILEIVSKSVMRHLFWVESELLGMKYNMVVAEEDREGVHVDIEEMLHILETQLDQ